MVLSFTRQRAIVVALLVLAVLVTLLVVYSAMHPGFLQHMALMYNGYGQAVVSQQHDATALAPNILFQGHGFTRWPG